MNKIIGVFLTIMFISANVFADTAFLLNSQNYTNGCNISNLGVGDGSTQLVPNFSINTYVCNPGYYLPADGVQCEICPNDYYCVGGAYQYNTELTQGISECPNSWYSPAGMHELESCGRILHIGDTAVYLRSGKKTTPSLNVRIGNDVFYGNATTQDVNMNADTSHKLKIQADGVTWSIYDDSVTVSE